MNVDDALIRLGESTSDAVAGILQMFAGDAAQPGPVAIVPSGSNPLQTLPTPAVAASVSYIDGVTGGNVFVMPLKGARALAAAMMGEEPPEDEADELTELELSAVGEAMNQMMAAAAHATSGVFTVFGQPCRLVQLVPNAFVMRMTKALDELGAEYLGDQGPSDLDASAGLDESLRAVDVRVWAELGRGRMPIGHLVGMPAGAVVELDREADEPVDLFVNGMRFASGRLVVGDGGEWAVEIESLVGGEQAAA